MTLFKGLFAKIFALFVVNKIKRSYHKAPEIQQKILKSLVENSKKTALLKFEKKIRIINK